MRPHAGCRSLAVGTALLTIAHISTAFTPFSPWSSEPESKARSINKRADKITLPAPVNIAPSQYWDGVDGPWSSFPLQMGNHAQDIRAMISTAATFTWGIQATGCPANYVADCENSRGFFFLTNESITWTQNSDYQFGLEDNLGYDTSGTAGWDDVTIGWQGAETATANHSVVFTIQDSKYWIGGFGLNPRPTNFTTLSDPQPSFLEQLKVTNQTPSVSYGYTAGNQYRLNKVFGSLTLGGYDQNRFAPTNLTFPFYEDISRDLLVNIQQISMDGFNTELLPGGAITAFIDSTTPWIWLPEDACKAFEDAFSLTYNEGYGFYLVNSTQHDFLTSSNYSVTFTLGTQAAGGQTVNITLPYGAFDLQINFPYIESPNTSYYFPLMRAANDTQYTLGRAFLQEAYLIADYERQNFTVAPCTWTNTTTADLKSIISPNETSLVGPSGGNGGGGVSGGAIAGIAIGIVAVIAILGALLWFFRRRKTAEKKRVAELEAKDSGAADKDSDDNNEQKPFISNPIGGELGGGEIHELTAPYRPQAQEMDSPYKVDPNKHGYSEMEGGEYFGPGKNFAHEMQGSHGPVYEMAGSEVQEMPATEPSADKDADKR